MPNKYAQVEGIATFLHHRGPTTLPDLPPDTSRGRPILCLHDAGDNGGIFAGVLDALAEAHSPLAFDQPGHARSGRLDSLGSVPALAAFTGALCDKLGLEPAVLLGKGLGAAVAVELAVERPDRVAGVVLTGLSQWRVEPARLEALRLVTEGKARREFDRSGYAHETPREVYARAFAEWIKTDPRALYGDLQALHAWDPERARSLGAASLVVVGDAEADDHGETAGILAEATDARVVRVSAAGHRIALEQPAALAREVAAFAAALPS